jgi:N-acetylneuraminic acid mutarotase
MTSRCVAMLSVVLAVSAAPAQAGTWSVLPPLSPDRYAAAAAANTDALFLFGGANAGGNLSDVSALDSGASGWSGETVLPAARAFAGAAPIGTSLLILGGFEDSGFPSNMVSRLDPASGTWTGAAPLPSGCAAMGCAALNGMVYAAGGESNYGALSSQSVRYDPAANAWSAIATLPTLRSGPGAAVLDGRFYVIGGAAGAPVATVEAYDPLSNAWSAAAPLPEPLWSPAAATFSGRIWVMGGFDASFNPSPRVYSMGSDGVWRAEAPLPEARAQASAAALGSMLVVAGGLNGLGEPTGTAYAMSADAQPPAETLDIAVTINPGTLNLASQGQWLSVILTSQWPIADLDLASVTLGGVAMDLGAPQTINSDLNTVEVKFPRAPFTLLSPGEHALTLSGHTLAGVPVQGHGDLTVIGNHAPRAKLTPIRIGSGQTGVSVTLDQPAMTSLDVVDLQGRLVDRIESGYRPAGTYSVTWPANGRAVRSGLYFVRFRAPGSMAMTRLVVSH